jgi:glucose/arabinose dehydrogenase
MKTKIRPGKWLGALVLAGSLSQVMNADETTAFQLAKEGNRYVSEEAKDKIVQIRSDKSVNSMVPVIWYVVYFDQDAKFRATEVKFGAGKKLEVTRPMRMFERVSRDYKPLETKDLKIDSDEALKIATKDPLLDKLTLKASQMWLDRGDEGPTWRVRLWAAKLKNPNSQADIGQIFISAEDGKVFRRDLHINRVD